MGVEGGQHEGAREERQRGLLLPEERHPGLLGRGGQVRRAGRRLREEGCPGGRRVHGGGGGADGLQRGPQDRAAVRQGRGDLRVLRRELKLPIFGTKLGFSARETFLISNKGEILDKWSEGK